MTWTYAGIEPLTTPPATLQMVPPLQRKTFAANGSKMASHAVQGHAPLVRPGPPQTELAALKPAASESHADFGS
jgi:hypothetical protein